MRLSPIRTIRIVIASTLILLATSFSFLSAYAGPLSHPAMGDGFQIAVSACTSSMVHHNQNEMHGDMHKSVSFSGECSSESHSGQECCGSLCVLNIGAEIHHQPVSFIQRSHRLKQSNEISLVLPFQADSLFRPPRA